MHRTKSNISAGSKYKRIWKAIAESTDLYQIQFSFLFSDLLPLIPIVYYYFFSALCTMLLILKENIDIYIHVFFFNRLIYQNFGPKIHQISSLRSSNQNRPFRSSYLILCSMQSDHFNFNFCLLQDYFSTQFFY